MRLYEPGSVRLIRAGDFADGGLTIQTSVTQHSFPAERLEILLGPFGTDPWRLTFPCVRGFHN